MKMNKGALIMALLMAAHVCNAAVLPSGSRFDPRNQIVSYNPNNTTIINSAVGYTTWICPYISRHLLSLNPLQARCRRYSRGER